MLINLHVAHSLNSRNISRVHIFDTKAYGMSAIARTHRAERFNSPQVAHFAVLGAQACSRSLRSFPNRLVSWTSESPLKSTETCRLPRH